MLYTYFFHGRFLIFIGDGFYVRILYLLSIDVRNSWPNKTNIPSNNFRLWRRINKCAYGLSEIATWWLNGERRCQVILGAHSNWVVLIKLRRYFGLVPLFFVLNMCFLHIIWRSLVYMSKLHAWVLWVSQYSDLGRKQLNVKVLYKVELLSIRNWPSVGTWDSNLWLRLILGLLHNIGNIYIKSI